MAVPEARLLLLARCCCWWWWWCRWCSTDNMLTLQDSLNTHTTHSTLTSLLQQRRTTTHTHTFNSPFSRTTQVSRYQKGKTNLGFTEARDSQWQWHQLGYMQVCTSPQSDNHASTPPLSFIQAGCPSCHPTNSVKALKASACTTTYEHIHQYNSPTSLTYVRGPRRGIVVSVVRRMNEVNAHRA